MRKNSSLYWFLALVLAWSWCGGTTAQEPLTLESSDRILVLAPHPDDEVLGCGGVIQEAVKRGLPVRMAFLTYGDNNQWSFLIYRKHPVFMPRAVQLMGETRHDEALTAASVLGVPARDLTFLGYPDFGTLNMWYGHWDDEQPFRSMFTRVRAVPYATAMRPGAPYKADEVLRDLETVLREFRPTKIFVSHPADHNTDHRALYLFTRVALWDLQNELRPRLYPYLIHMAGWPNPMGQRTAEALSPPKRLAGQVAWSTFSLSADQLRRKERALWSHRSQMKASPRYLESFLRTNELFGDLPDVRLRPAEVLPAGQPRPRSWHDPVAKADQLIASERAAFVGVEWQHIRLEPDALVLSIELSRPLAEEVRVSLFAFGYRPDKPFAQMPKIHIRIGELATHCYDQDDRLSLDTVQITRTSRQVIVRIPLSALGQPTRVLTSAYTYLAAVPLDWAPWRAIELLPPVTTSGGSDAGLPVRPRPAS